MVRRLTLGLAAIGLVGLGACGRTNHEPKGHMNGSGGRGGEEPAAEGGAGAEAPAPASGGAAGGAGAAGSSPGFVVEGGSDGEGGTGGSVVQGPIKPPLNYAITGSWPGRKVAIETRPGKLEYTKVLIHDRFLAQSCAIGDYNGDGDPDISSGRRWYAGPFGPDLPVIEHVFRGGHDDLPRNGDGPEINTGVSDDWADYVIDMDLDGDPDIINVSNPDVDDAQNPSAAPAPQPHSSAYWYENPGFSQVETYANWDSHVLHKDVRMEQHGIGDIDGDGWPELLGACKGCDPQQRIGYYHANLENLRGPWKFHAVTRQFEFPFNGTGFLHGVGMGDVNGDGQPDLLTRAGVWIDPLSAVPNELPCPAPDCGFVPVQLYGGGAGGELGGAQMFAADFDGDGDGDIVSADFAHNYGISWYEQTAPLTFVKHQFVGGPQDLAKYGVSFSEAHALEVADMDGDGIPDLITGKTRFAHPNGYGDPDLLGDPVVYVFRTVRTPDPANGGPVTFEPHLVDKQLGVGWQIGVGHLNDDGIPDFCLATKVGLAVFLGQ